MTVQCSKIKGTVKPAFCGHTNNKSAIYVGASDITTNGIPNKILIGWIFILKFYLKIK